MRILFVVPYVPSLIRTRPYNLVRSLTARGHEVTVITPWFDESEHEEAEALRSECHRVIAVELSPWRRRWNRFRSVASLRPVQATLCWNPELARRMDRALLAATGQFAFDIAHIEHLRAACYGLHLRSRLSRLPIVWDCVDCMHMLMEQTVRDNESLRVRLSHAYDALRMRSEESRLLDRLPWVLVTSRKDRDALASVASNRHRNGGDGYFSPGPGSRRENWIKVLPNGVDLDYFRPSEREPRDPSTLVMSGKMSYHANVAMVLYFVKKILPLVRARRPDVKLCIAGKNPPREVARLAQLPGISVTGTVPDLCPYLRRAAVALAPVRYGVGIQNKVLEAMACGTPVVGSPQSISALRAKPGEEVLVAAAPDQFSKHILGLLEEPRLRERFGQAGRRYVEREHSWPSAAASLEEIYWEAIQSRRGERVPA